METPPLRASPTIPSTPLHGAAYDNLRSPHRYSTRSIQRRISRDLELNPEAAHVSRQTRSSVTPGSSRRTSAQSNLPNSPRPSPKHKAARRVQIISPSSPDFGPSVPQPTTSSNSHRSFFHPSTTTMTEGMLPTPVKTPKKKTFPKINAAARALFQDQSLIGEEVASPRRDRKAKRYNGFSLESFSTDADQGQGRIQIFTDSRDKVPVPDVSESNPFMEPRQGEPSSRKLAGTSKRRKISGEKKMDLQVDEAIKKDEGMVYVFRGKKVFRRFDDADEEEEVIDTDDLGLLEHTPNGNAAVRPLKTLTRKSIKPTRLFQSETQKTARAEAKEEEAATDIEDHAEIISVNIPDLMPTASSLKLGPRATRSTVKKPAVNEEEIVEPAVEKVKNAKPSKKGSPFDSWKRLKAGASASTSTTEAPKSKKRVASETIDNSDTPEKKFKAT